MYRTPYNPYGTCIGSQKLLTVYGSDPAQSVWDLYRTSNIPYGICICKPCYALQSPAKPCSALLSHAKPCEALLSLAKHC